MPSDLLLVFASLIVQNGIQLWFSSVFSFFTSLLLPAILSFHVSSFVKCLFMFSAYFSLGLSYLLAFKAFFLYILDASPRSVVCHSDPSVFSLSFYSSHGDLMNRSSSCVRLNS